MNLNEHSRIFGVIDLRGGVAVHAIAGRREEYRPLSLEALGAVASVGDRDQRGNAVALLDAFLGLGVGGAYIADLDSICDQTEVSLPTVSKLLERPGEFWIDLGISGERLEDLARIRALITGRRAFASSVSGQDGGGEQGEERAWPNPVWPDPVWPDQVWPDPVWIVPSESVRDLSALRHWLADVGSRQGGDLDGTPAGGQGKVIPKLAAGLDLRDGKVVSQCADLSVCTPQEAVELLVEMGFQRLCVIDIASVGTEDGGTTVQLCRRIRQQFPEVTMIGGGGGRGLADFQRWWDAGCDAVLSATWLLRQKPLPSGEFSD